MQLLKTWQWFPCRAARSDLGARISHQWRDFQIYTCSNYNITRLSDTLLFIYFISFYHFFVFSLSVSFLSSIITKAHKDKVASDARSVGQQWLIGFLLFPICRWSVLRMLTNQLVGKETDKGCTQSHNPSDLPTRLGRSCFKTGSYRRRPFVGRERITVGWFLKFLTIL